MRGKYVSHTEICEFLIEDTQSGPATHVETIEEVRDPLDGASDQLYVFSVDPVSLQEDTQYYSHCTSQ